MQRAIRTPVDGKNDEYSWDAGTDNTDEDLARQEFKDEADVNWILARFGVHAPSRQPIFGDVDFDTGLQDVYAAAEELRRTWTKLDPDLRKTYPTWQDLQIALRDGLILEKKEVNGDLQFSKAPTPVDTPPEPPIVTPPL